MKITQRQEVFCVNYFKTGNATQSALTAKYAPNGAAVTACRLLRKTNIIDKLNQLRQKAEDAAIMDVQERKRRLSEIARTNLTQFMELGKDGSWVNLGPETTNAGAIQEIHSRTEYDENGDNPTIYTSVKLHDPLKAIDLLNKMDKLYSDTGTSNVFNIDNRKVVLVSDLTDEQLTNIITSGSGTGTLEPPTST